MIDKVIVDKLKALDGDLKFKELLDVMECSKIPYKNKRLRGPLGFAAYDAIYLDLDHILCHPAKLLFFVILHETAHYKRIMNMGKSKLIEMLSIEDFNAFCEHVIEEEIVADRYGRYMYYKLNNESFPIIATQRLHEPLMKERYRPIAGWLFGKVQNDEANYQALVNSFLNEE